MSHGGEILALGQGSGTEASFEVVLWGYDKKQVNGYVAQVEAEIAALDEERGQAYTQVQALAGQVEHLREELGRLHQRPAALDRVSFRHLGPYVEQLLTVAEEQAHAIRAGAAQEIEEKRRELDRLLTEAREKTEQASRDFELALAARRAEAERVDAQRQAEMEAELAAAREEAQRLRREATEVLAKAEQEAVRITDEATAQATRVTAEADTHAQSVRADADSYAHGMRAEADSHAQSMRAAAEAHSQRLRTEADTYSYGVRSDADAYAASVITQADQDAAQVKTRAEQKAAATRSEGRNDADQVRADAQRYAAQLREQAEQQAAAAQRRAAAAHEEAEHLESRITGERARLNEAKQQLANLVRQREQISQELAQVQRHLGELTDELAGNQAASAVPQAAPEELTARVDGAEPAGRSSGPDSAIVEAVDGALDAGSGPDGDGPQPATDRRPGD